MKKIYLLTVILLLTFVKNFAQTPYLVKDIKTGGLDSSPRDFTNVNGTLFFSADNGASGRQLWKSDGTTAGTNLVKIIAPGTGLTNSFRGEDLNGILFFSANDGLNGMELWRSDGTQSGTYMVKDINLGGNSNPSCLTNFNGNLYFSADDGINGVELWKSDGTASGTVLLKDIYTGVGNSNPGPLSLHFAIINNEFIFTADDSIHGTELWKSDGTEIGTIIIKDIVPGSSSSNIYFNSNIDYPTVSINGILYFIAQFEIWKTDGTSLGTSMLTSGSVGGYSPAALFNYNGTLIYAVDDGMNGYEIYKSDGTVSGTSILNDICLGSCSSITKYSEYIASLNGNLFFCANDGLSGNELWKSNGTVTGTTLVKDINIGSLGSTILGLTTGSGYLLFTANDGLNGQELWKSDGTTSGTVLLDIVPGSSGSYPYNFMTLNDITYFVAADAPHGYELWAINTAVGIKKTKGNLSVSVFPNPSTDFLNFENIDFKSRTYISIENIFGETVLKKELNENKMNVMDLTPAVYFFKIENEKGIFVGKFLKQ
ncbi:MAG: T9SS type A sorting domain-containing protein [Bacteroidetes bacterium]|nr:T9SS type A sorting domain-containing protein [Bacteroidota bacterium]